MKVYADTGPVMLWVNGVRVGAKTPDDHVVTWTGVRLVPGVNLVRVTAARDGRPVTDTATWLRRNG